MAAKEEKRIFTCVWAGVTPTEEELEQILEDHKYWFYTHGYMGPNNPPHDLSEIILVNKNFPNAELMQIKLNNSLIRVSRLESTKLQGAELKGAILQGARLQGADFQGASLERIDLQGAKLQGACFVNANLSKANLYGTSLYGADLTRANLSEVNVTEVKYDRNIKCLGVRADSCYGNPLFKRFLQDQDYLEAFQAKYPIWYKLWWLFADCGRSLTRWAAWSLLFALLFGFFYADYGFLHFLPEQIRPSVELSSTVRQATWFTPYYFSIVTFTTLGFGDVTPQNLAGEIWITIEVILGYIMLGGLISILANKLARRS